MKWIGVKDARGSFEWRTISQDFLCSICIFSFLPRCIYPRRKSLIPSNFICCDGWFELRHFLLLFFYVLLTTAVFVIKWLPSVNDNVRVSAYIPRSALQGDLQTHLQVQYTTSALQTTFIRVKVCNRYVFWLSPFGRLFIAAERKRLFAFSS